MAGGGRGRGGPTRGSGSTTATGSSGGTGWTTATGSSGGSGWTTATGSSGGSGWTTATGSGGGSGSTTATGSSGGSGWTTTATWPQQLWRAPAQQQHWRAPAQPQQHWRAPALPQQLWRAPALPQQLWPTPAQQQQFARSVLAVTSTAYEAVRSLTEPSGGGQQLQPSLAQAQQLTRLEEELETEKKRRVQAEKKAAEDAARYQEEIKGRDNKFSSAELHDAVNNPKMLLVGTGRYGRVYKSTMGQMAVAIKIPNESLQRKQEFNQEVDILKRIRHPNLVTLIGASAEKHALVYEFLSNGTLEDRLAKKEHAGSFSWEERVRIASSIRSALMFLHSSKPDPIIHGDLKPTNVLFDAEGICKLSDFGMSRLLQQTSYTIPGQMKGIAKGIFELAMGADHGSTQSDVLAFGIIMLQLVTGQAAKDLRKEVLRKLGDVKIFEQNNIERQREVLIKGQIVDAKLDKWATEDAAKMVLLGLRCSDPVRAQRPDLAACGF